MKYLQFLFFRMLCGVLAYIPMRHLSFLKTFTNFILSKVLKYRSNVIDINLKKAFPLKSDEEKEIIKTQFYRYLSANIVDSAKGLAAPIAINKDQFEIKNPEIFTPFLKKHKSVLVVSAHFQNWEWGFMASAPQFDYEVVIVYKKSKNPHFENFIKQRRASKGVRPLEMGSFTSFLSKHKDEPKIYILMSDQNPSNKKSSIKVKFFNQETICLKGPELISKRYKMPIFLFETEKVKAMKYAVRIKLIAETSDEERGLLTQKYMSAIESMIKKNPYAWLWSHKRWKNISSY